MADAGFTVHLNVGVRDRRVSAELVRLVGTEEPAHAATASTTIGRVSDHEGQWSIRTESDIESVVNEMVAIFLRDGAPFTEALTVSPRRTEELIVEQSFQQDVLLPLLFGANGEHKRAAAFVRGVLPTLPQQGEYRDFYVRFADEVFELSS